MRGRFDMICYVSLDVDVRRLLLVGCGEVSWISGIADRVRSVPVIQFVGSAEVRS